MDFGIYLFILGLILLFFCIGGFYGVIWIPTKRKDYDRIISLVNLRPGVIFCDIGSVWNNTKLYQAMQNDKLKELKLGYGFGPRLNIGYFILKLDWAWHTDLSKISKPYLYFSLEAEF